MQDLLMISRRKLTNQCGARLQKRDALSEQELKCFRTDNYYQYAVGCVAWRCTSFCAKR